MFAVQGGIYLLLKTEGELHDRIARAVPRLMVAFFVLNTLVVDRDGRCSTSRSPSAISTTSGRSSSRPRRSSRSARAWLFVRRGEAFRAFLASSAMIGLLLISGGIGLYPNLIISTIDPAYNLTISNAASADNTLEVALDHRRSSGCRSCCCTRPASTTSSGARPSSTPHGY